MREGGAADTVCDMKDYDCACHGVTRLLPCSIFKGCKTHNSEHKLYCGWALQLNPHNTRYSPHTSTRERHGCPSLETLELNFLLSSSRPDYLTSKFSVLLTALDPRLFESFIQVIGILLGFTVVGIFYYLGRIDDQKHDYINSRLALMTRIKDAPSEVDERAKKVLEAFDKAEDENKKFYMGEQIRQSMAQLLKIRQDTASLLTVTVYFDLPLLASKV